MSPALASHPPPLPIRPAPAALDAALRELESAIDAGPLDARLNDLVRARVEHVTACPFCGELRAARLPLVRTGRARARALAGWSPPPGGTAAERAALALTDAMMGLADLRDCAGAARAFSPPELGGLLVAIAVHTARTQLRGDRSVSAWATEAGSA